MSQEQIKQVGQVVNARYGQSEFLQQSFEVLLGGLLAVEARLVMVRPFSDGDLSCDVEVRLGLVYP